jgi:predicted Zn-dependent protease
MAPITASDTRTPGRSLVGAVAILAGIGLLALGVPRFLSGMVTLDLRAGASAQDDQAAARALDQATAVIADGEMMVEQAVIEQRLARPAADVIALLKTALAHSPANPKGWALLASLLLKTGDRPAALQALRLSYLAGPVVPELMAARLSLAMALLDGMDVETRALTARQVRLTWMIDPKPVIDLMQRPGLTAFLTEALGAQEPD